MSDMSDQYDDGRYDSGSSIELPGGWRIPASQAPERFLPGGDPRLPEYRGVESPPAYFPPIPRGGIKYPTSAEAQRRQAREAHPMSERMTKAQIAHELEVNRGLMAELRTRRHQLQRDLRKAIPAEPRGHTMFTVAVRFTMHGQHYQYLILRNGEKYFTTGTKDPQKMFTSWAALCEWLEGPDVYSHSNLEILTSAGKVISFDSGLVEELPMQEPSF